MTRLERVMNELIARFEKSNWNPITVDMKCNGDKLTITPCSVVTEVKSYAQVDYYLVKSPSVTCLGGDSLRKVARQLIEYQDTVNQTDTDKDELARIRDTLVCCGGMPEDEWESLFDFYSDFHKDTYGFRPRDIRRPKFENGYAVC